MQILRKKKLNLEDNEKIFHLNKKLYLFYSKLLHFTPIFGKGKGVTHAYAVTLIRSIGTRYGTIAYVI